MDRIINTKTEQQSIYEIYRACRLCGAGAGYKMPIIQNVVDLDTSGIELRQKIQDCVQIEVHSNDKMPPLICELCVDKVNDFYEFVDLCQRTNKRTRMRLGLPPQTSTRVPNSDASSNSGDCILGVTEPVYQNDSDEPLAPVTRRTKQIESKLKVIKKENSSKPLSKEISLKQIKDSSKQQKEIPLKQTKKEKDTSKHQKENSKQTQRERESSKQKRPPTPPRMTRHSKSSNEDTVSLSTLKQQGKKMGSTPQPKSILKRENYKEKNEDTTPTRSKRPRDPPKPEVPQKKVKLTVTTSPKSSPSSPTYTSSSSSPAHKPGPRSRRAPSPPSPAPRTFDCGVCGKSLNTTQALGNHVRRHTVQFTSPRLACDACQMWFVSPEETQAHHKWHRGKHKPYHCKRCGVRYSTLDNYTEHIVDDKCLPWEVVPDKQCPECWKKFATDNLVQQHSCGGPDARPGGKCSKCKRVYSLLKNLKKHQANCTPKKKVRLPPEMSPRVLVARCDALLARGRHQHYDVSDVKQTFGLARNCVYPYIYSYSVRSELPQDSMVKIKAEIEDCEVEDYVHWDSDTDSEGEATKTVNSLSTLALKKIFSKKCLGKVPKKRRKIKLENNAFDSLLNASEFDMTLSRDINNIIDNLGNDDSWDKDISDRNEDNQNGSDEESLLTNYVLFDNSTVANTDKVVNNVEDSNDSQSILDANTPSGNVKVSENSISNTNDNDTDLDKDSFEDKKETKDTVDDYEKDIVQEISKVSSDENNYKSVENKIDDSNLNSSKINEDRKEICNEDENNDNIESSVNLNNDIIHIKENNLENSADSNIKDDRKNENTNIFINDLANINTNTDCSEDISVADSLKNTVADNINSVNIEKSVENTEIVPKNDSENISNETKNTSNNSENLKDSEITNNVKNTENYLSLKKETENPNNNSENLSKDNEITNIVNDTVNYLSPKKISNGELDEKSDKLSFDDKNDISDTDVDDKELMDALNEQIGDEDKVNKTEVMDASNENIGDDKISENDNSNPDQNKEHLEHEAATNEQNGAKHDSSNEVTNQINSKDHENAINDLLSENKNTFIEDVVSSSKVNDCETDKISLEDLFPKSAHKPTDLDSISDDDFDFDSC